MFKLKCMLFILLILTVSASVFAQQQRPMPRARQNLENKPQWDDSKEEKIRDLLVQENIVDSQFLNELKENDPQQYRRFLIKNFIEFEKLERIKDISPDYYQRGLEKARLDGQCWKIAWNYRNSSDQSEQQALRTELKQKLGTLFDLREKDKRERIEKLEEELATLKEMVRERQENREDIIERRLNDMLRETDSLSW